MVQYSSLNICILTLFKVRIFIKKPSSKSTITNNVSDCFCNEKGTLNCDEQRETCNCTKLMKDDACTAANLTTATYIKRFMTSNCIKVHFS
jgi:hypothetical protein